MGENRLTGDASLSNHRLTVPQAAARLGMTEAAVRGRIKRRTLRSERESGTVYVLLEGDEPTINRDEPTGQPTDQYERIEDLHEQVAYLREQLDRERKPGPRNADATTPSSRSCRRPPRSRPARSGR